MNQEELNVTGEEQIKKEAAVPATAEMGEAQPAAPEEETLKIEQKEEPNVPLAALQAEREKRQQLEERLRIMEDHLALNQAGQSKEKPKDVYEGLDEADYMTVGEHKKLTSGLINQFHMTIEELKMTQKHPDYQEVISKYLPDVLKQNPSLHKTLKKTQDYELAYHLAKKSDKYQKDHKKKRESDDAKRIVENSKKSGSLSSVGSVSPVSQAKRYKDMSDSEFETLVNRNMM